MLQQGRCCKLGRSRIHGLGIAEHIDLTKYVLLMSQCEKRYGY